LVHVYSSLISVLCVCVWVWVCVCVGVSVCVGMCVLVCVVACVCVCVCVIFKDNLYFHSHFKDPNSVDRRLNLKHIKK